MATPIFFQRNCVAHRSRKKSFIAALHHGIIKKILPSFELDLLRIVACPMLVVVLLFANGRDVAG
jgi:hypothetical protein